MFYSTRVNTKEAKLKYEQALAQKPNDSFAKSKIEACKKQISDIDAKANKEKLYTQYKDEGDKLFNRGKYTEAKRKYAAALTQEPGDGYVTAKIEACDQRIAEAARERDRLYSKYRDYGETFLKRGKYTEAKQSFRQALIYKPRDAYIVGRISETDRLIKQAAKTTASEWMVKIPAGTFMMGSNDGESDEKPVHKVSVAAFYMDKYEVTVEKYEKFLKVKKKHRKPPNWSDQLTQPKHPVVNVSWQDATAYAEWASKRLPTEAEWEYAARGGNTGVGRKPIYEYPWGNNASHDKANYRGTEGKDQWNRTSPAGSFEANGYGLYDMAGNVWEWCADWYDEDYYKSSPEQNPKGLALGVCCVAAPGTATRSLFGAPIATGSVPRFGTTTMGFVVFRTFVKL